MSEPKRFSQWVTDGVIEVDADALPGIAKIYDSKGVRRLWPAPKNQADVEDLWVAHQMDFITIERVVMSDEDLKVYTSAIAPLGRERIIVSGP